MLITFGIIAEPSRTVENTILIESGFIGIWSFYIWAGLDAIVVFLLICVLIGSIKALIQKKRGKKGFVEQEYEAEKDTKLKKKDVKLIIGVLIFVIVANVVLSYCAYTDVRIVTQDTIIKKTPLNHEGTTYRYSDVISYEVFEDEGNVVFELEMNDNKKVRLGNSAMSSYEYEDDEYALSVIDDKLRAVGAEKRVMCVRDQFLWADEEDVKLLEKLLSK